MSLYRRLIVLVLSLGVASQVVMAEDTQSLAPVTAAPSAGQMTGMIDLRPTISNENSSLANTDPRMENTVDLGYQFNPNMYLGYRQYFLSGNGAKAAESQDIIDSIVRVKAKNIWTNGSQSFNYEARLYLPFSQKLQDASHNMSLRHYFIGAQKLGPVTVQLMEIPILHSYSASGYVSGGKATANAAFENRVYLVTSLQLTEKLGLDFPILYHTAFNRTYDGAINSNRIANFLWIYPELDYAINKTFTVGVAYYSDNLMGYDAGGNYTGLDLATGLQKGAVQAVLQVNL